MISFIYKLYERIWLYKRMDYTYTRLTLDTSVVGTGAGVECFQFTFTFENNGLILVCMFVQWILLSRYT